VNRGYLNASQRSPGKSGGEGPGDAERHPASGEDDMLQSIKALADIVVWEPWLSAVHSRCQGRSPGATAGTIRLSSAPADRIVLDRLD
jgi:hypothetical protein